VERKQVIDEIIKRNTYAFKMYGTPDSKDFSVISYVDDTIDMCLKAHDYEGLSQAYIAKALHYTITNPDKEPYELLSKVNRLIETHQLSDDVILKYNRAFLIYYLEAVGDFEEALKYSQNALQLAEKINDKEMVMRYRSSMAVIYSRMGLFESSKDLLLLTLEYYTSINSELHIMYDSNNLAEVYYELGDYNKSEELYLRAQNLAETCERIDVVQDIHIGLARIYRHHGDFNKSLELIDQALNLTSITENNRFYILTLIEKANHYIETKDYQKANQVLSIDDHIVQGVANHNDVKNFYEKKAECAELVGNYKEALLLTKEAYKQSHMLNTIINERAVNEAMQMEYKNTISRLETIATIGRELATLSDLDQVLAEVRKILSSLMTIDNIGIGEVTDETIIYSHYRVSESIAKPNILSLDDPKSLAAWCINHKKEIHINDLENESKLYVDAIYRFKVKDTSPNRTIKSLLYAPLIVKDEVIGVFTIQSYMKNAFHTEEIEIFRIISSYVAIAFKNIIQSRVLEKLSIQDSLTKLNNRRGFLEMYESLANKVSGTQTPIALLMLDLDHFKMVNDTYGHAVGDKVLINFSRILLDIETEHIHCARLGGEEFAIVITHMVKDQVTDFMLSVLDQVESMKIKLSDIEIGITTSVGVVFTNGMEDITYKKLYRQADQALYHAKESGRNRGVFAD